MRILFAAGALTLLTNVGALPAHAADGPMGPALAKLTRGVVNTATGLPAEILAGAFRALGEARTDTLSGYVAESGAAVLLGAGRGVVRTASGIVDIVTFGAPFDDNRPLFEPDYAL